MRHTILYSMLNHATLVEFPLHPDASRWRWRSLQKAALLLVKPDKYLSGEHHIAWCIFLCWLVVWPLARSERAKSARIWEKQFLWVSEISLTHPSGFSVSPWLLLRRFELCTSQVQRLLHRAFDRHKGPPQSKQKALLFVRQKHFFERNNSV